MDGEIEQVLPPRTRRIKQFGEPSGRRFSLPVSTGCKARDVGMKDDMPSTPSLLVNARVTRGVILFASCSVEPMSLYRYPFL